MNYLCLVFGTRILTSKIECSNYEALINIWRVIKDYLFILLMLLNFAFISKSIIAMNIESSVMKPSWFEMKPSNSKTTCTYLRCHLKSCQNNSKVKMLFYNKNRFFWVLSRQFNSRYFEKIWKGIQQKHIFFSFCEGFIPVYFIFIEITDV